MFQGGSEHTRIGKFYIVPEIKRSETEGDLAELLEDEEVVESETEDDTPF
jgi:hypothetical protein